MTATIPVQTGKYGGDLIKILADRSWCDRK